MKTELEQVSFVPESQLNRGRSKNPETFLGAFIVLETFFDVFLWRYFFGRGRKMAKISPASVDHKAATPALNFPGIFSITL